MTFLGNIVYLLPCSDLFAALALCARAANDTTHANKQDSFKKSFYCPIIQLPGPEYLFLFSS